MPMKSAKGMNDVPAGAKPADALNDMGIERYCCRRMFLSHVEIMEKVNKYSNKNVSIWQ